MNTSKHMQGLLGSALQKNLYILSESPQSTPFLHGLSSDKIITLPCSDSLLINTALGMGISGTHVLVCLSTDQELSSLFALLEEEQYGPEFPLPIVFLVPSFQVPSFAPSHKTTYARTGTQLWNNVSSALQTQCPHCICYNPAALFDVIHEEDMNTTHTNATVHSFGTHISLFVCGPDIEEAMEFAQSYDDVELIELHSIHPLCRETIRHSVQKTGRALLINTPLHVMNEILDQCFWSLEAQIEHTTNHNTTHLTQLRTRLLEP